MLVTVYKITYLPPLSPCDFLVLDSLIDQKSIPLASTKAFVLL
jgi:hypothetical protein